MQEFPDRGSEENGMKRGQVCVLLLAAACALAMIAAVTAETDVDAIEKQIGELQKKKDRLEEAAELEQEIEEMRRDSRECVREYEEQIAELNAGKDKGTAAELAQRKAYRKHLFACLGIHKKILAIDDPRELEKARQLISKAEEIATEWWLVLEPQYDFAANIQEMARYAEKEGTVAQKEVIKVLKQIHEQDMANRRKEFELFKKRAKNEAAKYALVDKFWD